MVTGVRVFTAVSLAALMSASTVRAHEKATLYLECVATGKAEMVRDSGEIIDQRTSEYTETFKIDLLAKTVRDLPATITDDRIEMTWLKGGITDTVTINRINGSMVRTFTSRQPPSYTTTRLFSMGTCQKVEGPKF